MKRSFMFPLRVIHGFIPILVVLLSNVQEAPPGAWTAAGRRLLRISRILSVVWQRTKLEGSMPKE